MKASELRIGNLVYYRIQDELDDRKEWNEVNIVDAEDILYLEACEANKWDHPYSPIPLTDEGLECLGLVLSDKTDLWTIDDFGIHMEFSVISTNANEDLPKRNLMDIREIKYVHELQNIYHANTRKELKAKKQLKTKKQ